MNQTSRNHEPPIQVTLNASNFYALVDLLATVDKAPLDLHLNKIGQDLALVDASVLDLAKVNDAILKEASRVSLRRPNPFDSSDGGRDGPLDRLHHSMGTGNFIHVIYEVVVSILDGYHSIQENAQGLRPQDVTLMGQRISGIPKTLEEIQILTYQTQMNEAALRAFISGVFDAERAPEGVIELGRHVVNVLEQYYSALLHRHSVEGVQIHNNDPIATDVAISVFENVDANGEIQDGKDPKEVSAYSVRKAILIADTVRVGLVGKFIRDPDLLIQFIVDQLACLWETSLDLAKQAAPLADKIRTMLGRTWDKPRTMDTHGFKQALEFIKDCNPRNIAYTEKTGLLTAEERKEMEHRNHTLSIITRMMREGSSSQNLIDYILERKHTLRNYHLEENSFFVCKIGAGNPFGGEAPGTLSVVPGNKPSVKLVDVRGSGFNEVKDFIANVKHAAKWHDLFIATSPSKKADKANVLLVGPQGCGKTEVLRAVASDRASIGIFAQSSDFLTCWKGEAEKNPKRLFEAGIKLQRESKKQVFFLIDEIDTILNDNQGQNAFGGTNLATEFQVLMDGITTYPNLALWGATNHPERIPMPLIRRFAKVVIVGELDQTDRRLLLQQFVGYLPVSNTFTDEAWDAAALKLEGAVGDVVRKVADHVWREKMGRFVDTSPSEAEKLVKLLNKNDQKFNVAEFSHADRHHFIGEMAKFEGMIVTPTDVMSSIDAHLGNQAIQAEIQTCRDTYNRARSFMAGINAR